MQVMLKDAWRSEFLQDVFIDGVGYKIYNLQHQLDKDTRRVSKYGFPKERKMTCDKCRHRFSFRII